MKCKTCSSERIVFLSGKCNDMFAACMVNDPVSDEYDGYVPTDMGIGRGDSVFFRYCLDCGQIDGKWPLPACALEKPIEPNQDDKDD